MKNAPSALFLTCILYAASANAGPPAKAPVEQQSKQEPAVAGFNAAVPLPHPPLGWPLDIAMDREALVYLNVLISPQGKISEISLLESRGFHSPPFVRAAMSFARALRFKPATQDGKPVEQAAILPVKFSIGGARVSPEFMVEAQKVNDLFKDGDYAGADFHAEWMLKEKVRSGLEYAVLKSTLAQTHASLGHDHEAILFAEEATRRLSLNPAALGLHQPIPPNHAANYLLPRDLVIRLLNLRLQLATSNGMVIKALQAYYELAGLEEMASDDPRAMLAAQLTAKLESSEPLAAKVMLLESGWEHDLYRRRFTLENVSGTINSLTLSCGIGTSQSLPYTPGEEWTAPDGPQCCVVHVNGEAGTRFTLVELAD